MKSLSPVQTKNSKNSTRNIRRVSCEKNVPVAAARSQPHAYVHDTHGGRAMSEGQVNAPTLPTTGAADASPIPQSKRHKDGVFGPPFLYDPATMARQHQRRRRKSSRGTPPARAGSPPRGAVGSTHAAQLACLCIQGPTIKWPSAIYTVSVTCSTFTHSITRHPCTPT